jgi:hypothetical protein
LQHPVHPVVRYRAVGLGFWGTAAIAQCQDTVVPVFGEYERAVSGGQRGGIRGHDIAGPADVVVGGSHGSLLSVGVGWIVDGGAGCHVPHSAQCLVQGVVEGAESNCQYLWIKIF